MQFLTEIFFNNNFKCEACRHKANNNLKTYFLFHRKILIPLKIVGRHTYYKTCKINKADNISQTFNYI